jgi:hypothetical protein
MKQMKYLLIILTFTFLVGCNKENTRYYEITHYTNDGHILSIDKGHRLRTSGRSGIWFVDFERKRIFISGTIKIKEL